MTSSILGSKFSLRDVDDVEALCRKVADDRLGYWGAKLRRSDYDDLIAYLIATCWELDRRYDPKKDKKPNFGAYAAKILTLRCADWFRQRFGDRRHGRDAPVILSLDAPSSSGDEGTGSGRSRLVEALGSWEGDPAVDRSPDLVGTLERGSGGEAGQVEAVGEPEDGRARQGDHRPARLKKPRVPAATKPPREPAPFCEHCVKIFAAAFVRVDRQKPKEERRSKETIAELARKRAEAVRFADEWICPRCTTIPFPDGTVRFFEQIYPNRRARRAAERS